MNGQASGAVITLKGTSREFLRECLDNGWLQGEALKRVDDIMAENTALRHENTLLKGRLAEQRKVNKSYRRTHLEALKYQFDAAEGWKYTRAHRWQMMFAAVGIAVALTCLAIALAITRGAM